MKTLGLILTLCCLVGCGGGAAPSSLQTCKDNCSFQKKCAGFTSADVSACQAMCNQNKATLDGDDTQLRDSCKNSSTILQGFHDCYTQDCDATEAQDCANAFANSCEPK